MTTDGVPGIDPAPTRREGRPVPPDPRGAPAGLDDTALPPATRRETPPARHGDGTLPSATRPEEVAPPATRRESGTGERRNGEAAQAPTEGWTGGLLRLPGSLRDTWQIVDDLPGGGEADVLLVADPTGRRQVVKIYRRHVTIDAEAAWRLTRLDRSHLVAPYRTGHDNGRHWELMEYVAGDTLARRLDQPGGVPMSTADIVETIRQVTEGLTELHRAQITHGDLKPSNILVRQETPLRLALSDFGLSKYLGEASKRFTQRAHTVAFAAPESFSGRFSPAQDWWALGMVVRQLVTGEAPFAGLSEQVAMHELLVRDVSLENVADGRFRTLCRGLLVRDPDHRWAEEQVRSWLAGGSPTVHDASDVRAARPLVVGDRTCWTRAEAARAFASQWDLAQQTFLERIGTPGEPGEGWRLLRSWMEQFDSDVPQRIRLVDQVLTAAVPPEVRMVHLLRWLDPTMPPTYRQSALLPEHIAGLAADAETGVGTSARIVHELWRHQLLGLLGQFAGGAELVEIDRRWRTSLTQLETIREASALPGPARNALGLAGPTQLAALLRAAADPGLAGSLAERATAARQQVPEPPPWFASLQRVQDPAVALAVLTVLPVAQAEYDQLLAVRNRGQLTWDQEEQTRVDGQTGAMGYAAAAIGIWGVVLITGAFAAAGDFVPAFGEGLLPGTGGGSNASGGPSNTSASIALVYGMTWLANAAAELAVGYRIGGYYHPRWSALSLLRWLGRRAPDAWDYVRRSGNAIRTIGAASPFLLGLLCCLACCLLGPIIGVLSAVYAIGTLAGSAAHLVWALVRGVRFHQLREERRRTLLGDNPGGQHL